MKIMKAQEICKAEDVLTLPEKIVYEILWNGRNRANTVKKGYDVMARESKFTKRNIVNIVRRLVDKGFLEVTAPPMVFGRRAPTTYKVLSFALVRQRQKRSGRNHFYCLGTGIFYAPKRMT